MKFEPVILENSSVIKSYQYDDDSWVLTIHLHSGKTYNYQNVPPELYADFNAAPSKGTFYNQKIKGPFSSLVEEAPVAEPVVASTPLPGQPVAEPNAFLEGVYADMDEGSRGPQVRVIDPKSDEGQGLKRAIAETGTLPVVMQGEPQLGDLLAPDQVEALQPKPAKLDAVDKLALRCLALAEAPVPAITDAAVYTQVQATVNAMKADKKLYVDLTDPFVKLAYEAYIKVREKRDCVVKPMDEAIKSRNDALNVYDREQEEIAEKKRQAEQVKAEEAAEEERKRRSAEINETLFTDAMAAGDEEAAQAIMDAPVEAPQVPVYVPPVQAAIPQVAGTSKRENWSGVVTNFEELVLDIAEGIKHFRAKGNLGGHAPLSFLEIAQTAINQSAKAQKKSMAYPGLVAENNPVRSTRGGR